MSEFNITCDINYWVYKCWNQIQWSELETHLSGSESMYLCSNEYKPVNINDICFILYYPKNKSFISYVVQVATAMIPKIEPPSIDIYSESCYNEFKIRLNVVTKIEPFNTINIRKKFVGFEGLDSKIFRMGSKTDQIVLINPNLGPNIFDILLENTVAVNSLGEIETKNEPQDTTYITSITSTNNSTDYTNNIIENQYYNNGTDYITPHQYTNDFGYDTSIQGTDNESEYITTAQNTDNESDYITVNLTNNIPNIDNEGINDNKETTQIPEQNDDHLHVNGLVPVMVVPCNDLLFIVKEEKDPKNGIINHIIRCKKCDITDNGSELPKIIHAWDVSKNVHVTFNVVDSTDECRESLEFYHKDKPYDFSVDSGNMEMDSNSGNLVNAEQINIYYITDDDTYSQCLLFDGRICYETNLSTNINGSIDMNINTDINADNTADWNVDGYTTIDRVDDVGEINDKNYSFELIDSEGYPIKSEFKNVYINNDEHKIGHDCETNNVSHTDYINNVSDDDADIEVLIKTNSLRRSQLIQEPQEPQEQIPRIGQIQQIGQIRSQSQFHLNSNFGGSFDCSSEFGPQKEQIGSQLDSEPVSEPEFEPESQPSLQPQSLAELQALAHHQLQLEQQQQQQQYQLQQLQQQQQLQLQKQNQKLRQRQNSQVSKLIVKKKSRKVTKNKLENHDIANDQ